MQNAKTSTNRLFLAVGVVVALIAAFVFFMPEREPTPGERTRQAQLDIKRAAGLLAIKAKDAVRPTLKDPDSAQFGQVFAGNVDGTACGTVSAKNSFGAYTGQTRFITALTPASSTVDDGSAAFGEQWERLCAR